MEYSKYSVLGFWGTILGLIATITATIGTIGSGGDINNVVLPISGWGFSLIAVLFSGYIYSRISFSVDFIYKDNMRLLRENSELRERLVLLEEENSKILAISEYITAKAIRKPKAKAIVVHGVEEGGDNEY